MEGVTKPSSKNGKLGFSYTKIAADGTRLAADATEWACVKDNITGLMWEVKTADGGLRDYNNTYTNWGSNRRVDARAFVRAVNATGLCGKKDWRLPTRSELQGLVDYGVSATDQASPDPNFFPNTFAGVYWTSSRLAGYPDYAWGVLFGDGNVYDDYCGRYYHVRLVR